ncbi:MAG: hypothetical protein IT349_04955 [Candidatus Eisenbacteria bacterium]|nr:hypothetical protein [Candidatus Eisenbacteria bacterium]
MRRVDAANPVTLDELRRMAGFDFGGLVKAVVDLERSVMLIDAEMHSDQEAELIATGSNQASLWGINLYPDLPADSWIEFDSMINLRPSFGNRTRGVDDPATQERIRSLVHRMVAR